MKHIRDEEKSSHMLIKFRNFKGKGCRIKPLFFGIRLGFYDSSLRRSGDVKNTSWVLSWIGEDGVELGNL